MQFRCLGPLGVSEAGRDQPLGGPKQRLVRAHLLVRANQTVPIDMLAALVWDDDPPPAARSSLQSYVSHLRRSPGAHRIESSGRAQDRAGRQGDALAAYDRARARLADQLGINPSDELRSLHQRVLSELTRDLTDAECQQYLHLDACPSP
ncbi:MAG TPA: BTAD domain-containing putative transcriptional regulator [Euzebyales bacterium]|nr:BTAD domain-containing putative transcriptional regulator [Euzebyales bacterium]